MEEKQTHRSKADKGQKQVIRLKSANKVQGEAVKNQKRKKASSREKIALCTNGQFIPRPWIILKRLIVQLREAFVLLSSCLLLHFHPSSLSYAGIYWFNWLADVGGLQPNTAKHSTPSCCFIYWTDSGRKSSFLYQVRVIRADWRDQMRQNRNRTHIRQIFKIQSTYYMPLEHTFWTCCSSN